MAHDDADANHDHSAMSPGTLMLAKKWAILALQVVQVFGILWALLGGFGFDHAGENGLSFGHFLSLSSVCLIALCIQIALAVQIKWWAMVFVPFAIMLTAVLLMFMFP